MQRLSANAGASSARPATEITKSRLTPFKSGGRRLSSTEYSPQTGMASTIHASPACNSSCSSLPGAPCETIRRMPTDETSMPASCRRVGVSRSSIQEHSSMNSGAEELSSTALIAVVVLSPR